MPPGKKIRYGVHHRFLKVKLFSPKQGILGLGNKNPDQNEKEKKI